MLGSTALALAALAFILAAILFAPPCNPTRDRSTIDGRSLCAPGGRHI